MTVVRGRGDRSRGDAGHTSPVDEHEAGDTVLAAFTDRAGAGLLTWAAAPLQNATTVLDVSCGTGALATELGHGRWIGVDDRPRPVGAGRDDRRRDGVRGRVVRAVASALPIGHSTVDGIALVLALPQLPDLDAVFAELRRVLRPGGTLVVVVPSASIGSVGLGSTAEWRLAPVLAPVHRGWRHRSALDRAGWLLAAADFALLGDDRRVFTTPLSDVDAALDLAAALPRTGLWPPEPPEPGRARATAALVRRAGPGRVLPLALRRLVARR